MDPDPTNFIFTNKFLNNTSAFLALNEPLTITLWVVLVLLIIISGFFSGAETAFTSVNETRLRSLAKTKRRAKYMLNLHKKYDQVLSTLLIGNNLVNIAASTISAILFGILVGENNGPWVSTLVLTVAILIFGEISPKLISKERPDKFLMIFAYPILFVYYLFWLISKIFDGWKWLLIKIFKLNKKEPTYTEEEFQMVVSDIKQEGVINQNEHDLIKKSLKFDDSLVKDVMQDVSTMVYLTDAMTQDEMKSVFLENNYSRVPYISATTGHVLGIILQRDFYEMIIEKNATLEEIINPCMFVKGNSRVSILFNRMKKLKQMMAVVLDDDRHLIGLITMEDCLEELVGEIDDEQDAEDEENEENNEAGKLSSVESKGHSQHRRVVPQSKLLNEVQGDETLDDSNEINDVIEQVELNKLPETIEQKNINNEIKEEINDIE